MGPQADAVTAHPTETVDDVEPRRHRSSSGDPRERDGEAPPASRRGDRASVPPELPTGSLRISTWLFDTRAASALWLVVRVWLGYQWINAGYQKIWGSERSAFWFGGGAAVKGFSIEGIAGSTAGKGGASYGWWAGILHDVVIPNSSWIAKVVSLSELVIGVALVLGLFTGAAAFAGLSLNGIYMLSGTSGVNPAYAILSVLLILAWRNAGWIGLDRFVLSGSMRRLHVAQLLDRLVVPRSTAPITL